MADPTERALAPPEDSASRARPLVGGPGRALPPSGSRRWCATPAICELWRRHVAARSVPSSRHRSPRRCRRARAGAAVSDALLSAVLGVSCSPAALRRW